MKILYFILATCVLIIPSCTIQKRQHMPGYHVEWNTIGAQNEVHRENKPEQTLSIPQKNVALAEERIMLPLQQVVESNLSESEEATPSDLNDEVASIKDEKAATFHSKKSTQRELAFPFTLLAPSKVLSVRMTPEDPPTTDGMCKASMVCGIIGVIGTVSLAFAGLGIILCALAILFGFVGLARIRRNPELKGREKAITGIILGFLPLVPLILVWIFIDELY